MENIVVKKRIWELDALRGLAFIFMAFDHLTFDLGHMFLSSWSSESPNHFLVKIAELGYDYRQTDISLIFRIAFISGVFLFVSGISANLSKNNLKRGLKLLIIALTLSVGTFVAAEFTGSSSIIIYFGILHLLAISMILTPLLKKLNKWLLLVLAVLIIFLGHYFENFNFDSSYLLVPFNITPSSFTTADYYPLFPYLSLYIIGLISGSLIYKDKKSLFKKDLNIIPLNFLGRNALWLYFAHQVLLIVFLYLIGIIFI